MPRNIERKVGWMILPALLAILVSGCWTSHPTLPSPDPDPNKPMPEEPMPEFGMTTPAGMFT